MTDFDERILNLIFFRILFVKILQLKKNFFKLNKKKFYEKNLNKKLNKKFKKTLTNQKKKKMRTGNKNSKK